MGTDFLLGRMNTTMVLVARLFQYTNFSEANTPNGERHGESKVLVAQLGLTLCDFMDCSLPGFSIHGMAQARTLDGLPFPSPEGLPDPGIKPRSPTLQADCLPSVPPGNFMVQK